MENLQHLRVASQIKRGLHPTLKELLRNCKRTIYPEFVDEYPPLKPIVVDVRRVTRTLTIGKVFRFRVVVAIGAAGILGVGVGKGDTVPKAKEKAIRQAKKDLVLIQEITDERGQEVYMPIRSATAKKGATRVTVLPLEHGSSVTGSKYGKMICRLAQITKICIRVGNKGKTCKGKAQCRLNYFTALKDALKKSCQK